MKQGHMVDHVAGHYTKYQTLLRMDHRIAACSARRPHGLGDCTPGAGCCSHRHRCMRSWLTSDTCCTGTSSNATHGGNHWLAAGGWATSALEPELGPPALLLWGTSCSPPDPAATPPAAAGPPACNCCSATARAATASTSGGCTTTQSVYTRASFSRQAAATETGAGGRTRFTRLSR